MGGVYQMVSESGENSISRFQPFHSTRLPPSAGSIEGNDMNRMLKKGEMVSLATPRRVPRARKPKPRSARCCAGRATIPTVRAGRHARSRRALLRGILAGYDQDPRDMLQRTFEEVEGYDEVVVLRDIRLESHCEHHMVPIIARCMSVTCPTSASSASASWHAWSTPTPTAADPGEAHGADRQHIAGSAASRAASPSSSRRHNQCMTTRGVHKSDVTMVTSRMLGAFRDNGETRREFLTMIGRTSI